MKGLEENYTLTWYWRPFKLFIGLTIILFNFPVICSLACVSAHAQGIENLKKKTNQKTLCRNAFKYMVV
jgi:hypothetical protein